MEYARRQGLRNYSTTQACVYADTQITVQHLEGRNPGFTNNQIVRQQLNPNLWGLRNADDWHSKRDKIITDALGDDGIARYREHFNSRLEGGSRIQSQLQTINKACDNVRKRFEKEHCRFFRRELNELGLSRRLSPLRRRKPKRSPTGPTKPDASSQSCDKLSHCSEDEIKEVNVCIIEKDLFRNLSDQEVITFQCPPESIAFSTENEEGIDGILRKLDGVAQNCQKIKRLQFRRHGTPGRLGRCL